VPQVHKRWYMVHWLLAEALGDCVGILPLGRKRYKSGKTRARTQVFKLEFNDWAEVSRSVRHDVDFLKACGLCDYSLIIGSLSEKVKDNGDLPVFPGGMFGRQPYIIRRGEWMIAYYVGIIDFLQGWTTGKKVAHVIKVGFAPKPISTIQPEEYAAQFLEANEKRFEALPMREIPPGGTESFKLKQSFVFVSSDVRSNESTGGRGHSGDQEGNDKDAEDPSWVQDALEGFKKLEMQADQSNYQALQGGMSAASVATSDWTQHSTVSDAGTDDKLKELGSVAHYDC